MTSKLTSALALALSLGLAVPAFAQSIEIGRDGIRLVPNQDVREERIDRRDERAIRADGLSEREAVRIARSQGVREVDAITKTRRAYRIAGIDRRGDDIRVDIDRRSGEVLSVR
ncbi:MAG: PepSY domain-containing protein [Fulvimarina manganoxydans]|uniref:PepSY domain-containing protein n=1 Tax=Fulvimarina manganoxydans TaxID=937218 RepID=UPI00235219FE|nr:PepSY domain-containing protein [Fulvimarina manganoxydans]MCK5933357.1 PepSY domain-containing protein [Fulvimarina manganoxydans]